MSTCIEIIGLVQEVKKDKIIVQESALGKSLTLICPSSILCPVSEFDALYAVVELKEAGHYMIQKPPLVQLTRDKECVIKLLLRPLRGTGYGLRGAHRLYEAMEEEGDPVEFLCKRAYQYVQLAAIDVASLYSSALPPDVLKVIFQWWHKHYNLRRLYVYGLTNTEIENCKLSPLEIYEGLKNPYKLIGLTMEKCDSILQRRNETPNALDRRCGEIVRRIQYYMEQKSWSGVPSTFILSQYPDYPRLRLMEEFGVRADLHTIYLSYPYRVETELASFFASKRGKMRSVGSVVFHREDLTIEQKEAIRGALQNEVSIITGGAGTGKSTIIREIISNLEQKNITYLTVAFTGKAVARLRQITGRKSPATFHRLMAQARITVPFEHLIVDEASMVMSGLFYEFIRTFPGHYSITFVGDVNQLQPIQWGSLFEQLLQSKAFPVFHLHQSHRVKEMENEGILLNATQLIENEEFTFQNTDNFNVLDGNEQTVQQIVEMLFQSGVSPMDITILTPYNQQAEQLNKLCQSVYMPGEGKYRVGDRMMMLENNYEINIMNGEEGKIIAVAKDGVVVEFADASTHTFIWEENVKPEEKKILHTGLLIHSFAVTIHRAQGSEWDYILFYLPSDNTQFLNRNLIYTAITRARRAVWCVGDINIFENAARRASQPRCENLATRIQKL